MATTYTSTLKPSGGDYTSIAAWVADDGGATSKDLNSNDEKVILECYKGNYSGVGGGANYIDEGLGFTGWTTTKENDRYLVIKCPDTEKHDGTLDSGFWWQSDNGTYSVLEVATNIDVDVEFLQIKSNHTVTYRNVFNIQGTLNLSTLKGCILENAGTAANLCGVSGARNGSANYEASLRSCLLINTGSAANALRISAFTDPNFENLSVVGYTTAFEQQGGATSYQPLIRNCVTYDCTNFHTDAGGGYHANTGYNASSTYSTVAAPDEVGSSNYTSNVVSGDFENTASDDYHLASGSALYDIGVDLSVDFDYDIDNDAFSTEAWSIGMDAGQASGITGTGALSSQAAAVAGVGEVTKTGTGALSAQASAVAGTGTVSDLQAPSVTSAAINGDGDQLSINFDEWVQFGAGGNGGFALSTGETLSYFTGAGTTGLVYDISPPIVAGATVTLAYTQPGNGVEDGSNNDLETFTGQAISNGSNLNTGTGALAAGVSAVAGTGTVGAVVTGTGALSAQAAAVAGTGEITKTGTGALASAVSTVAGVGTVGDAVAGTGALSAQTAALAASGTVERKGTGALAAAAAAVAGSGTVLGSATGTGAIVAEAATIAGVGLREITGTGALASGAATVSGAEIVVIYDEIELAVTITREHPLQMTVTREVST